MTFNLVITASTDRRALRRCKRRLSQISRLLESLPDALQRGFDLSYPSVELVRVDFDCRAAGGTCHVRIVPRLTNCYLELLAALRAGNRQLM